MPRPEPTEQTTAHGARIRAARTDLGWTQPQLSGALAARGVTLHTSGIARVESGERKISLHEAEALAEVLHLHIGELIQSDEAGAGTADGRRLLRAEEKIAVLEDQVRRLVHVLNATGGAIQAFGLAVAESKAADEVTL